MFAIAWKNKVMFRTGIGYNKYPSIEAAKEICDDLNQEYENFEHVPIEVGDNGKPLAPPQFSGAPQNAVVPLKDTDLFPFGEHCGTPMAKVPASYLRNIVGDITVQQQHPDIIDYVERNRAAIDEEVKREEWGKQENK